MRDVSMDALQWIELSEENFEASFMEMRADPALMQKFQKIEE